MTCAAGRYKPLTHTIPSSPARTHLIGYGTVRPQQCDRRNGAKVAQPTYCARGDRIPIWHVHQTVPEMI